MYVDSVTAAIPHRDDPMPRAAKLVVFDTTCFGQTSGRIARVLAWARRHDVPVALVRSHAKLDSLGIEYGRLGSIVLTWRRRGPAASCAISCARCATPCGSWARRRFRRIFRRSWERRRTGRRALRARRRSCATRGASRVRLRATPLADGVTVYPHALYLTLEPRGELRVQDVKRAVASLCETLSAQGLAVRHAGSFGFDFTALEWFTDPVSKRNVIRIAPGDVPRSQMDTLAAAIAGVVRAAGAARGRARRVD